MAKSAVISARIEPELKYNAEQIFEQLGLNISQAITLFFGSTSVLCGTQIGLAAYSQQFLVAQAVSLSWSQRSKTTFFLFSALSVFNKRLKAQPATQAAHQSNKLAACSTFRLATTQYLRDHLF